MNFNEDCKARPTNMPSQAPDLSSTTTTIRSHSNNSGTAGFSSATLADMTQDASDSLNSNTVKQAKENVVINSDYGEVKTVIVKW